MPIIIQEVPTREQVAALDRQARERLVEVQALVGLVESGCLEPSLFAPQMTPGLRCVHVGDGEFSVFAVNEQGEIRQGCNGPMTARELANELKQDPGFHDIGWKPRPPRHPAK